MITNREEVIDKAFKVFLRMNYEKARGQRNNLRDFIFKHII